MWIQLKNKILSLLELHEITVKKKENSQEKRDQVSIHKTALVLSFILSD